MSLTVEVTQGEGPLRWMTITDDTGDAIDVADFQVSLTPLSTGIHAWQAPDQSTQLTTATVRLALRVDNRFTVGSYRMRARYNGTAEVDFIRPDHSYVTVT